MAQLDGNADSAAGGADVAGLRDLMGLLALPALWAGKDAETVLNLMADAARSMIRIDAVLAETRFPPADERRLLLKLAGARFVDDVPEAWRSFARQGESPFALAQPSEVPSPMGPLRVLRLHMGAGSRAQRIWFASRSAAFPTWRDTAFLRAAVSLAASGINAARLEFERRQAARAKDEFLAMLGHELRNPLAPIVTALSLVKLKGAGHLEREIAIIERQVGNLGRLVDDLLDITRITKDKVELRLEDFEISEAVQAAAESVALLMEQKRHQLSVDVPPHGLRVRADRARLAQVFSNLLVNAGKYTAPDGAISVSAGMQGGRVHVSVRDNGRGIEPELLPLVFGLFEQGPAGLDRSGGGLGVGLAIVKKLVELHEGTVVAQSVGLGTGATFTVTLAAAPQQRVPAAEPVQASGHPAGGHRVLLVDDNRDALQTMELLLGMHGFVVAAASSPAEALAKAPDFDADVFVLDIGLPGLDGYELAQELRKHGGARASQARFIALTGYGQPGDKAKARASGFHTHLTKPIDLAQLVRAIVEG
ncbi:ATP-binding protein [Ramlibacter sp.]|uniref:hybrid sensor histidine kinase/response regulator n=1 Tax=Ramlibacter sp. TaxID=1917967 RepID=UPI001850C57A|nr:ATP-binding protein [Ramlibacter sp.]MBA2676295.1 response regulator [Ramlibacter sp.]